MFPKTLNDTFPGLLVIFGPQAVGKMTVGLEIAKRTSFKLFHNHMTIDLLTNFFEFGSLPFERLNDRIHLLILEELACAGQSVIVTVGWRLNVPEDKDVIDAYCAPFQARGANVSFVELRAPLETRLARNRTALRRRSKKLDWATDACLREADAKARYQSEGDFPYPDRHMVIDITHISPVEAAEKTIAHFEFPRRESPGTA